MGGILPFLVKLSHDANIKQQTKVIYIYIYKGNVNEFDSMTIEKAAVGCEVVPSVPSYLHYLNVATLRTQVCHLTYII